MSFSIKVYSYIVASILLFAGAFIAIPLTYSLDGMTTAKAGTMVTTTVAEINTGEVSFPSDEFNLEVTFLS